MLDSAWRRLTSRQNPDRASPARPRREPNPQCRSFQLVCFSYRSVWWLVGGGVKHPWAGRTDRVNLGVLTRWVAPGLVRQAVQARARPDLVPNALPLEFMVYYALALALFAQDSYEDVMDNLVGAIEELAGDVPAKSSIHAARKRLGAGVMEELFHLVAGQVAGERTAGARWRGRLVCAIDGFVLDVPESAGNRGFFGGPSTRVGGRIESGGYPQARVVTLVETGTRAVREAAIGPYATGERDLIKGVVAATGPEMIVIMDRGFPGRELIRRFNEQGTAVLMRGSTRIARADVRVLADGSYLAALWEQSVRGRGQPVWVRVIEYTVRGGERVRLLTNLLDPGEAPAAELAALYAERWESEGSNRSLKTYQQGHAFVLRSGSPELVLQEIWAHLTVNHALTRLNGLLADERGRDPDEISFTKVLKEVRRSVIRQAAHTLARAVTKTLDIADDLRRYAHRPVPGRTAERTVKRSSHRYDGRPRTATGRPVTTLRQPPTPTLLPLLST
ncbi:IS4 family transposase [Actinospica robiniae]|uniref:IS4 family transposase n=1 Tax=Actinospica robiniae TaxID=304901 RepID=UPI000A01C82B|nr:IS4 family transposase [Actinospica robiniae]